MRTRVDMRYPIRRIGVSKLATVSECVTAQGNHVAVKLYDKQPLSPFQHDKIFSAAAQWRTLSSPGLIRYLEVLPSEKRIVMEMMERSAAVRLREGYSDPRLVSDVLRGVLTSLAFIHEQGLLHVNIKPTNVFFDERGNAKLSDGWLVSARVPGALPPPSNQKYLTPEHTSDTFGQMSVATDLYAVGFLALELLAGVRFGWAFQGIADDTPSDDLAWFQWHGSSQEMPLATQFCKTCPPQLEAVISRLTKKNPAERYPSARVALAELPPETLPSAPSPNKAALAPSEDIKRPAFASDVLERPATGVVLAIASGPRAGEMFGTNETEFFIGFHPDCLLRFSQDQYSVASSKVMCRRGAEGWVVSRVIGENTCVNQRMLEDSLVLRSGDVIRLTSRGPDVQFTMQSGGLAIKALVSRFLPVQNPVQPNQASDRFTAAPGVEARGAPISPGTPGPSNLVPSNLVPSNPVPSNHLSSNHLSSNPATRSAVAGNLAAAPRRPDNPVETRTFAPASPRDPVVPQAGSVEPARTKVAASAAKATSRIKSAGGPKGRWSQPKTWNKSQKNTAIAVVGGLFVILLVVLIPFSPSKSPEKPAEQGVATEVAPKGGSPGSSAGEVQSVEDASSTTDLGTSNSGKAGSVNAAVGNAAVETDSPSTAVPKQ